MPGNFHRLMDHPDSASNQLLVIIHTLILCLSSISRTSILITRIFILSSTQQSLSSHQSIWNYFPAHWIWTGTGDDGCQHPNETTRIGSVVPVTITVENDEGNTFTLVDGAVIGGYPLEDLVRINGTTYTCSFTVFDGGFDYPVRRTYMSSVCN